MKFSCYLFSFGLLQVSSKNNDNTYTRIGVTLGGFPSIDDTEVIDLLPTPKSHCSPMPNFPVKIHAAGGGLNDQGNPIVCGGYSSDRSQCYILQQSQWEIGPNLNQGRSDFAITKSPFPNDGSVLFVTGGNNEKNLNLKSTEVLTRNGWKMSATLPYSISNHCMVLTSPNTVIVIGGWQTKKNKISADTFVLNTKLGKVWKKGPPMKSPRARHACAMIKGRGGKLVIVVGGFDGKNKYLRSTEVYDFKEQSWKEGPKLPFGITAAVLVEDPLGGVVIVGGWGDGKGLLSHLLQLEDVDSKWKVMKRKLKVPRRYHAVFPIPDHLCKGKKLDNVDL